MVDLVPSALPPVGACVVALPGPSRRVVSKYLRSQVLSGGCGRIVELSKQKAAVVCTSGK